MKVQPLRGHVPGYPRMVEVDDWERLLLPTAQKTFGRRALRFAGLLGAALLLPVAADAGEFEADNRGALGIA